MAFFSEDEQHMKRMYKLKTPLGRREIHQRYVMETNTEFYNKGFIMKFEYPMMVITNNKTIMMRRLRRIRKMKAVDASSSLSPQKSQNSHNLFHDSDIILHNINGNWSTSTQYLDYIREQRQRLIDELQMKFNQKEYEDFWSEDIHNIYENGQQQRKNKIYERKKSTQSRDINIQGNISEMQEKAQRQERSQKDFFKAEEKIFVKNSLVPPQVQYFQQDFNNLSNNNLQSQSEIQVSVRQQEFSEDEGTFSEDEYEYEKKIKQGFKIKQFNELPSNICFNFDDMDEERIEAEYLDMKARKSLNLKNKATNQSSHNQSLENLIKKFPKAYQNIKKKHYLFNTYADLSFRKTGRLENEVRIMHQENEDTTTFKVSGHQTQPQSNIIERGSEKQHEERKNRRQMIRQKAAQLLRKPKNLKHTNLPGKIFGSIASLPSPNLNAERKEFKKLPNDEIRIQGDLS